ncbi:MAG: TAXI family TRAP transporter solute-binding subunit, partial [Candidatus Riflebacteria bacterium]|nr:TAXI family TRAP transporter solute-binding subunit [Candidatus Riflebacteria bacterium]
AKDAMEKMKTKDIDGFVFTSGLPNPSIVELSKTVEIDLVPIDLELTQKLVNKYSFYFPSLIPPRQYSGQLNELNGLEINAVLVSGPTLSEKDQYLLTKHLFSKPNELGQAHPRLSKMTKATLRHQMPIPLGEGAHKALSEASQQ